MRTKNGRNELLLPGVEDVEVDAELAGGTTCPIMTPVVGGEGCHHETGWIFRAKMADAVFLSDNNQRNPTSNQKDNERVEIYKYITC